MGDKASQAWGRKGLETSNGALVSVSTRPPACPATGSRQIARVCPERLKVQHQPTTQISINTTLPIPPPATNLVSESWCRFINKDRPTYHVYSISFCIYCTVTLNVHCGPKSKPVRWSEGVWNSDVPRPYAAPRQGQTGTGPGWKRDVLAGAPAGKILYPLKILFEHFFWSHIVRDLQWLARWHCRLV